MRHGFWTSFFRLTGFSLATLVAQTTITGGIYAQNSGDQVTAKKTTEPVFRVSKLIKSREDSADETPSTNGADSVVPAKKTAPERMALALRDPTETAPRTAPRTSIAPATPVALPPKPVVLPPKPVVAEPAKVATTVASAPHPLDRAVTMAEAALTAMRANVNDYTAVLAKRERINGTISDKSFMAIKIRCPRTKSNGTEVPFSIYMKFLRPKETAGREVIWVDKQNNGKLLAHEGSGFIRRTFELDPTGFVAMRGQRHPIYEAGLENLIIKLIEKAETDRAAGPCIVNYRDNGVVHDRKCSVIELIHNEQREPYEYHKAQVFIDKELQMPIRFAAYDWPETPGAEPELLEEYTYYNVKVNVGLTDMDFSPKNKAYKFKR